MAHHIWTVVCARSIVDAETQNLTLLDILEQVSAPASVFESDEAFLPLRLEVVSLWARREPEVQTQAEGRLRWKDPKGEILEEQEYTIDLREHPRSRTRVRVPGLPVSTPGLYFFTVSQRSEKGSWEEVARIPIRLNQDANPA